MFDDTKKDNLKNPSAPPAPPRNGKLPYGLGPQEDLGFVKSRAESRDLGGNKKEADKPGAIEDIFSDSEKNQPARPAESASSLPAAAPPPPDRGGAAETSKQCGGAVKKIAVLAAIAAVVLALGYGGYWLYGYYSASGGETELGTETEADNPSPPAAQEPKNIEPVEIDSGEIDEPRPETGSETRTTAPDSDQDGLSDEEEAALGTNPASVDSDQDGLFDWEEVRVYKTDPLNADSDGDGYLDGDEVEGGYNPLGPGKLFEIEEELRE